MKSSLLLLHGAIGAASQFEQLIGKLSTDFDVHTFDFSGHGSNSYSGNLNMKIFEGDIINFMNANDLNQCNIFGYSMGGYAALNLSIKHPQRISRLMTLGTKWYWNRDIANKETKMLHADTISEKVPAFAEMLKLRHSGQGWKPLLERTIEMMVQLGESGGFKEADLAGIKLPVKICLGSEDRMVTMEESVNTAENLPKGTFELFNGVSHPIEKLDMDFLAEEIKKWFITT